MAKVFTAKLDVKPLKTALSKLKRDEKKALNKVLSESAEDIARTAKSLSNIPSIAATIKVSKESGRFYVSAGDGLSDPEIAAYHEFGTGDFAKALAGTLPSDWRLYAMSFYKNGLGRLPSRPYLFPAYNMVLTKFKSMKYLEN